ncbi:hypothetical protein Salat_0534600 [Sesamum alatum]|uniref:Uncharacterized protein n=1 Tax=Sesamum alatum TaxID=300844 RepID=A0AAE1YP91_9LAMI|nr:hypothetical protein Salat_0534600 [Sesamum alatum]
MPKITRQGKGKFNHAWLRITAGIAPPRYTGRFPSMPDTLQASLNSCQKKKLLPSQPLAGKKCSSRTSNSYLTCRSGVPQAEVFANTSEAQICDSNEAKRKQPRHGCNHRLHVTDHKAFRVAQPRYGSDFPFPRSISSEIQLEQIITAS